VSAEESFDLAAAGLRGDDAEMAVSLEVLAAKLEQALPGRARVERSGAGLLARKPKRVRSIQVDLGGSCYRLALEGDRLQGSRERQVGGISIKREPLQPQAWISALTNELRAEAERSSEAREALTRLLD
jgi:hypothetical protein